MKKIIILGLFLLTGFITPAFCDDDTTNKAVAESLEKFSFEDKAKTVRLKVVQENTFENGVEFEAGSILTAKIEEIVDPKIGKRDGYFIIDPISYTIPSTGETVKITEDSWRAKIIGYKPFDTKKTALGAGLAVAGHFVTGIGQFYHFGEGVMHPEDGENRLKSGVKNVYENSPLAYIEEGKEAYIEQGDMILMKFYYNDVPKWKFWERNQ